jgi:hypothetical protein
MIKEVIAGTECSHQSSYLYHLSMSQSLDILVLGGAGAQNSAVVRELAKNELFSVKLLSRDIQSQECISLATLDRVKLLQGNCYDESTLITAFEGIDACFVNTNGFAIGEKAEIYWGIRMYDIAYWAGVKHFVYSSLPPALKKSGFNPRYRVPFVDAKAKVCGESLFVSIGLRSMLILVSKSI